MTDAFTFIVVSNEGPVGLIELNDPEHLNPTNGPTTFAELNEALLTSRRDRTTRAVVLFGRGRAFSAGANLGAKRPARYPQDDLDTMPQRMAYGFAYGLMWDALHGFKKPIVAAVNGYCLGGGWELAHACDLLVSGESARFGAVELDIGLIPFATTTNYLPKMIGKHPAMDMILNAKMIDAVQALDLGLVNEVVPDDACVDRAKEIVASLALRPPVAISLARELVKKSMNVTEFLDLERAYGFYLRSTEDADTALRSKMARSHEPPTYSGR
jgi:enoyl-CoA hydratase/carnithine racemase